ncbi:hypothetical protein DLD77_03575 [Chitinophaga alhagiae]|uniref:Sodium:solute symporter n=1 Tax=Chitinophaga alhagiae TaxID=2203219 RepID=A0ABM6WA50_9BACT|nr:sodium/solute symporter [Chitinophaga alhagiae]AWO00840.1 hypothetical protein DLD77_03575 [Chitinophaga alhagiae]
MQIHRIGKILLPCIGLLLVMAAKAGAQGLVWSKGGELPVKEGLGHAAAGASNGVLLIAGGSNFDRPIREGGQKVVYDRIYIAKDGNTAEWQEAGRLPAPVANAAVVNLGSGLLVMGGTDGKTASDRMYLLYFKPSSGKVEIDTTFPRLPLPLVAPAAVNIGNHIYMAGGQRENNVPQHGFWRLDLSAGSDRVWEALPAWPGSGCFGAALAVQSNGERECIYLFGGKGPAGYLKDAFSYDVRHNRWKTIAALPGAAFYSAVAPLGQTHIMLFSGSDGHEADKAIDMGDSYHMSREVRAYHTITDTWTVFSTMPAGVAGAALVQWNNRLLLAGGELRPGVRTSGIQVATLQTIHPKSQFGWIDYTTLLFYLLGLGLMSFYFSRRKQNAGDYLLGSKNIPYWAAGISIMATQVSAIGFMSIPAKAYAVNWAYFAGVFTWFVAVPIVTRAYIPFIRKLNVASAYHYLEVRFNAGARLFAGSVFVLFQLARMGLVLYLPSLALAAVTPLDTVTCILIMGVLSTVYTVVGGIEAVIWIEVAQAILLLGGGIVCIILAIAGLKGGLSDFFVQGMADHKFSLGEMNWDFTSSTLIVILIGNIFIRLGNLTSDQAVVQRYMTTSDLRQAKRSVWTDVAVSIPWALVVYGLGTALYLYYKQHPDQLNPAIAADGILPMFIGQRAPAGLSGLIIAAIFAASMSTLEGSIHSVATIFTTDFYGRYKKNMTQQQAGNVAKIATVVLGSFATGLSLVLVFMDVNSILDVFQEVTGLFIGASTALFMLGIFTTRTNATGALIGAVSSGLILYLVKTMTPLSFWLYSAIGFLSCYVIGYLSSLVFPGRKALEGLTFYSINQLKEK